MRYRWSRLSTIGGVVSALAGIIGAIIPLLLDHKGFPLHTVLIYGGIVVAVVAIGALVSWIWSRIRRRLLKVRISGDATLAGVPDESYEVTKDSGKLATEDVRLKEYRTKRDEAEKELGPYLPANPRGAKRLINHERLYSQIAEDRHIFGGTPNLIIATSQNGSLLLSTGRGSELLSHGNRTKFEPQKIVLTWKACRTSLILLILILEPLTNC